jgi:DNA methylase
VTAVVVRADARRLPLPDSSAHAIVCDPPYELGFMGRGWDRSGVAFRPQTWTEALRVAIPGAHLLAFGGTRTYHRLAVAIEDAGWEIRDSIGLLGWCYGQGFPKSHDIGKAIDKAANAERASCGTTVYGNGHIQRSTVSIGYQGSEPKRDKRPLTLPATADAERWQGWGTALKPAWEPIIVARKPFAGTVAGNVLANGVGGVNVDGCRIVASARPVMVRTATLTATTSMSGESTGSTSSGDMTNLGRWPTNLLLAHHPDCADECQPECHVRVLDEQSGYSKTGSGPLRRNTALGLLNDDQWTPRSQEGQRYPGEGGASRFFPRFRYQAKALGRERPRLIAEDGNTIMHPTVKPVALMQWLVRLVTPPGGLVLDQFAGTGSTALAATAEGFDSVSVELDPGYCLLAQHKIADASR